jgi:hypothetical protein
MYEKSGTRFLTPPTTGNSTHIVWNQKRVRAQVRGSEPTRPFLFIFYHALTQRQYG